MQEVAPEGTHHHRRNDPNTDRPHGPPRGVRAADRSGGQPRQPGHEEARDQHLGEGMDGHGVRGDQRRREREHQEPGHTHEEEDRRCRTQSCRAPPPREGHRQGPGHVDGNQGGGNTLLGHNERPVRRADHVPCGRGRHPKGRQDTGTGRRHPAAQRVQQRALIHPPGRRKIGDGAHDGKQ